MHDLFHFFKEQDRKLSNFRRHPDWRAAFSRAKATHPELFFTMDDGRRALTDENAALLVNFADEEFIEQLIRLGH